MEHVGGDRVREILTQLRDREIAVLGDVMLDRYFWGSVSRVSPEAPVPVVDIDDESYHLGGAANVAANIHAIGGKAILFGVVGDDSAGAMLRSIAETEGLDPSGLVTSSSRPTTIKTRVIGNNQQLVRLDRETRSDVEAGVVRTVVEHLLSRKELAAIIIEDYDKGFLVCRDDLRGDQKAASIKRTSPCLWIRRKPTFQRYIVAVFLFKPNRKEAGDALGKPLDTQKKISSPLARSLLEYCEMPTMC